MITYDFKAARQRQQELIAIYRQQKRNGTMNPELEIEFMALIEEIDIEIAEVHKAADSKMTTVTSSGHSVKPNNNILSPIVTQWQQGNNTNSIHAWDGVSDGGT